MIKIHKNHLNMKSVIGFLFLKNVFNYKIKYLIID